MNDNKNKSDVITVDTDRLPEIIASQIEMISTLEREIEESDVSANRALAYAKTMRKVKFGNTKNAVVDTQESIEKLARAQQVTVAALKQSFEFQKKLADVSEYLFELGCANIAANRVAVRAIEAKLSRASNEKISELAKQEMMKVVKQLKEQEDILKRQEELTAKVKNNSERLNEKDDIDAKQTQRLQELDVLLKNKSDIDQHQEEAIKILFEYMKTKDEIDKKQFNEIESIKNGKLSASVEVILPIIAVVISLASVVLQFVK